MTQDQIAVMMRTMELGRRELRRKMILNEVALEGDSALDHIERAAVIRLRVAQRVETEMRFRDLYKTLSFWRRLKAAFLGRIEFTRSEL